MPQDSFPVLIPTPLSGSLASSTTRDSSAGTTPRPSFFRSWLVPPPPPSPASRANTSSPAVGLPQYSGAWSSTPTATPPSSQKTATLPPSTTTSTRERLRQVEEELSRLRLESDRKDAIADRLRRQGEAKTAENEMRLLKFRRDSRAADAAASPRSSSGLFRAARSSDVLFLIDTTGSMRPYIDAAKAQVNNIVKDISAACFHEADVRVAVVGYKDHNDFPNIQFLNFTSDLGRVRSFLNELEAVGGDDAAEDVLGGIQQAINAQWKHRTRCIIHIADAPPHGRTLHDMGDIDDSYHEPGSEPHRLTHVPLLRQMITLDINYTLLRINRATDRMALAFLETYATASPNCKLSKDNAYHSVAYGLTSTFRTGSGASGLSGHRLHAGLQFEELELGTSYSALRHLVVSSVTSSASRTAVRMSANPTTERRLVKKSGAPLLASIREDESDGEVALETTLPQWSSPGWLDETLVVEAYSADVMARGRATLDEMMASDDNIKVSTNELTIYKRSRPFAQGAVRVASYARTAASANRLVVKSFKRGRKRLADLAEDMRCQALCKAFALEFDALVGEKYSIDFVVVTCLKPTSGTEECMLLEPFIEGTYVKYNGNEGYVNMDDPDGAVSMAAQAFSHFTFERSRGGFLVCDVQGARRTLTDPAIHTLDRKRFRLARTNLNEEGFKFFFSTHVCNKVCRKLGLKTTGSMIKSRKYEFQSWPSTSKSTSKSTSRRASKTTAGSSSRPDGTDNVKVCCSNKLCSRMVRLATSRQSDEFPGFRWCEFCWPQLHSSVEQHICTVPGVADHEFAVSRFFYESQGQILPTRCPGHRAGAPSGSGESRRSGSSKLIKTASRSKSMFF